MPPRISVIIPSFNQAKYLERTILSVVNQNYSNYELIVVDGGSTDGSLEILEKYKRYLHKCISEPDRGQSQAINKGLKIAGGELIAYQNSDDIYLEGAFDRIAAAFLSHPECGVFTGNVLIIDKDDRVINFIKLIKPRLLAQVYNGPQLHNQAAFWTQTTMKCVGYMNEELNFCMDYEFFLRVLRNKIVCCHINEYIGAFRLHQESKTANRQDLHLYERNMIRNEFRSGLGLYRYLPSAVAAMLNKIYKSFIHIKRGEISYLLRKNKNVVG